MRAILVIAHCIILFFISCKDSLNQSSDTIPEIYVSIDDSKLNFQDSIYYLNNQRFSGYLTNKKNANKFLYTYLNGLQNGEQKGWHTNGNISFDYMCKNGKRIGDYKEYYPNGKLQIQRWYEEGQIIKNKILDLNGVVIANYTKRNGRYFGLMGSSSCITLNENTEGN